MWLYTGLSVIPAIQRILQRTIISTPKNQKVFFGGGNEFKFPDGSTIYSGNLTMSEETGIGKWTEGDFVKALKTGIVVHGQPDLRPPMKPYADLSDGEAKAVCPYLKTIPKINSKVARNL